MLDGDAMVGTPAGRQPPLHIDKLFEFLQNENPHHRRNERFVLK
jgi:hypothetical protein